MCGWCSTLRQQQLRACSTLSVGCISEVKHYSSQTESSSQWITITGIKCQHHKVYSGLQSTTYSYCALGNERGGCLSIV